MPDSKAVQKASYPLPAYNFRVTVDAASASFPEATSLVVAYEHITYRHGVGGLIPNPIDIRFQRVSGLGATVSLKSHSEGGQNLYTHRFPESIGYQNLVLERSAALISPLDIEFNIALSLFKFAASNTLVTLFDDSGVPTAAWMFLN